MFLFVKSIASNIDRTKIRERLMILNANVNSSNVDKYINDFALPKGFFLFITHNSSGTLEFIVKDRFGRVI